MHSQLVIAALVATASASANLFPGHMAIRRDLMVARQTESASTPTATSGDSETSDTDCQASLLSIATELPMPAGDLLSWEQENAGTDPCSVTNVPSSLAAEYTSYTEAVLSWYSASSSELFAALSACPEYADAASNVAVCTSGLGAAVTSATGSASATGSGSSASATGSSTGTASQSGSSTGTASSSASSSVETAGAAVREVGIVGAVLAGVLGVAVAL